MQENKKLHKNRKTLIARSIFRCVAISIVAVAVLKSVKIINVIELSWAGRRGDPCVFYRNVGSYHFDFQTHIFISVLCLLNLLFFLFCFLFHLWWCRRHTGRLLLFIISISFFIRKTTKRTDALHPDTSPVLHAHCTYTHRTRMSSILHT